MEWLGVLHRKELRAKFLWRRLGSKAKQLFGYNLSGCFTWESLCGCLWLVALQFHFLGFKCIESFLGFVLVTWLSKPQNNLSGSPCFITLTQTNPEISRLFLERFSRLFGPFRLYCTSSSLMLWQETNHRWYTNEWIWWLGFQKLYGHWNLNFL